MNKTTQKHIENIETYVADSLAYHQDVLDTTTIKALAKKHKVKGVLSKGLYLAVGAGLLTTYLFSKASGMEDVLHVEEALHLENFQDQLNYLAYKLQTPIGDLETITETTKLTIAQIENQINLTQPQEISDSLRAIISEMQPGQIDSTMVAEYITPATEYMQEVIDTGREKSDMKDNAIFALTGTIASGIVGFVGKLVLANDQQHAREEILSETEITNLRNRMNKVKHLYDKNPNIDLIAKFTNNKILVDKKTYKAKKHKYTAVVSTFTNYETMLRDFYSTDTQKNKEFRGRLEASMPVA